jgi:thiol:disulfide interchange protein
VEENTPHRRNGSKTSFALVCLLGWVILVGQFSASANAQTSELLGEKSTKNQLIEFSGEMVPGTARPGEEIRAVISADIKGSWHIYSLVPPEDELIPPTRIEWKIDGLIKRGPSYETNPIVQFDPVIQGVIGYHENQARFYQNFKVPDDAKAGEYVATASVVFQVCDDRICYLQQTIPVNISFDIENLPIRSEYTYMDRTIDAPPSGLFSLSPTQSLDAAVSRGLFGFLLLAVLMGVFSWLTPCVLPMVPITVSFFSKQAKGSRRRLVTLALVFSLGIVISFASLGLILTAVLGAAGAARLATSPWTNIAIAVLFTVFALNLMGVFEFRLPLRWTQGADSYSRRYGGLAGVTLMGPAFSLTAFTCTAPFVGTLLVAAAGGEWLWPVVGMLVFSVVFALPFFVLALFPGWIRSIQNKSGDWMLKLKFIIGLAEMMAVFKFLSNADLVWGWGVLDRMVVLIAWSILLLLMGIALIGWLPIPGVIANRFKFRYLGLGLIFLAFGGYMSQGIFGKQLDGWTESYLPMQLVNRIDRATGLKATANEQNAQFESLPWHDNLVDALEIAKLEKKPVFVDFTGYTCINCRWMEKNVFTETNITDILTNQFVLVRLFTDGGEGYQDNQILQIERFKTMALPFYVILSRDNAVLAKTAGISTPAVFLKFLNQALTGLKKESERFKS